MASESSLQSDLPPSSFDSLLDEVSGRIQRGESLSADSIACRPEYQERLKRCIPTLKALFVAGSVERTNPLESATGQSVALYPGQRFGEYELLDELGRGGMGIVYRARHVRTADTVAIKVLPVHQRSNKQLITRFRREAIVGAQLSHPNIAGITAAGVADGIPYYVMRCVDGPSLAEVFRRRPPAAAQHDFHWLAGIGQQIAAGLEHAHRLGFVHRDIKPANILIEGNERATLIDFGLARHDDATAVTGSGMVVGTLRYMSPEQVAGEAASVDHRTDIYSLGVTLYEGLTGQPLFGTNDREAIHFHIRQRDPVPPRRIQSAVPADLEVIVLTALAKDPRDRYHTAGELANDLNRFLIGQPIKARRPGPAARLRRWRRRHRHLVWLGLLSSLIVLTAFSMILLHFNGRLREEQAATQEALAVSRRLSHSATHHAEELVAASQRLQMASAWIQRGAAFEAVQRWDDAWESYARACQLRPDHCDAWMRQAELASRLGLWDDSEKAYEQVFRLHRPATTDAWAMLLRLTLLSGRQARYQELCAAMKDQFHGTREPRVAAELARTSSLSSMPGEILDTSDQLIAHLLASDPTSADYNYTRTLIMHHRGHHVRVLELGTRLRATSAYHPTHDLLLPLLATSAHRNGQGAEAAGYWQSTWALMEQWWQQIDARSGNNWVVHQGMLGQWPLEAIDWLEFQIHYNEALQLLGTAEQRRVTAYRRQLLRGRAFAGLRRRAAADSAFRNAHLAAPTNGQTALELYRNRGLLLVERGDLRGGIAQLRLAAEISPNDLVLQNSQAVLHFLAQDYEQYAASCRRLIALFGETTDAYTAVNLIYPCVLASDLPIDPDTLRRLAQVGATFWHAGGWAGGAAAYRLGEPRQAIDILESAAQLHELRGWDYCFLAMAHAEIGHAERALHFLNEAQDWMRMVDRSESVPTGKSDLGWIDWDERYVTERLWHEAASRVHRP